MVQDGGVSSSGLDEQVAALLEIIKLTAYAEVRVGQGAADLPGNVVVPSNLREPVSEYGELFAPALKSAGHNVGNLVAVFLGRQEIGADAYPIPRAEQLKASFERLYAGLDGIKEFSFRYTHDPDGEQKREYERHYIIIDTSRVDIKALLERDRDKIEGIARERLAQEVAENASERFSSKLKNLGIPYDKGAVGAYRAATARCADNTYMGIARQSSQSDGARGR